jgi:hypothetical protein
MSGFSFEIFQFVKLENKICASVLVRNGLTSVKSGIREDVNIY